MRRSTFTAPRELALLAMAALCAQAPTAADASEGLEAKSSSSTGASAVVSARTELGRKLFFDPILSRDRSISCASCHKPEHAFADNVRVSKGVGGTEGVRNTPSVMNSTARVSFFWDGRASSLDTQALLPIENPVEMALPIAQALERVNADPAYAHDFVELYGGPATARSLGAALAAFEKTLETPNSPYDRYQLGDDTALSEAARRGRLLFIDKANCASCHSGEDFTSDRFENIGLYNGKELNDRGRAAITGAARDEGTFKVPSLRNVAMTAPYMHNGMFASLRDVIDYYNDPERRVSGSINRDAELDKALHLTGSEIEDLQAFLESLTDDQFRAWQEVRSMAASSSSEQSK
jgi:cytochrome c peroxidase